VAAVSRKPWYLRWELWLLLVLLIYPFWPFLDQLLGLAGLQPGLDRKLVFIFIWGILALALNLQVGNAGLLQLGISAFFAIGAFTAGVLSVGKYPFHMGTWGALMVAPLVAAIMGLVLGGPTIRLRGDYLAIVTLGFGEVVRVVLINLEAITDGPKGLNPLPTPWLPHWLDHAVAGSDTTGRGHFISMYFLSLICLGVLVVVLHTLERSRTGRAFVALREDELASACMGVNPTRTKLTAFTVGAAIAGLAGALYATNLTTTAEPNSYDFNTSVVMLCCVIIGGLGSLRGALLGTALMMSFDSVVSPLLTHGIRQLTGPTDSLLADFGSWRLMIFGLALILMVRFRPQGLWPSARMKAELEHE
jgi:branched-chain amino acid transport system permease protein